MASYRLKRSKRGALTATVVVAAVGISSTSAVAAPGQPGSASDAKKKYEELSKQAEVVTEEYKKAQDDHAARRADLDRANAEAARAEQVASQARDEEERYRGKVDKLTNAAYQGAKMNKLSALLLSESPNDFLDRASTLDALAKDNNDAVKTLSNATSRAENAQRQAQDARGRAARAEADAARIQGAIAGKKAAMDSEVAKVKQTYNSLSDQEQSALSGGESLVGAIVGSGKAIVAVNAALAQQGKPYVYGAKGPDEFDCSGLVAYAYKQAGISIPGSTKAQVSAGQEVSQSSIRPGDVVFYYSSSSHNGIYIGGGKVVHAPTEGQNIKVESMQDIGDVNTVVRFGG